MFEGVAHYDALSKAVDAGLWRRKILKLEHGFTTYEGEFLTRPQAFERGKEMGQLGKGTLGA